MKHFLLFLLIQNFIFAENIDTNSSDSSTNDLVIIEDSSGLSDDEVRELAEESDTQKESNKVSLNKVIDAIDEKGKVDVSKIQLDWRELSPTPKKYDWIQTKSGEWFKGDIKAMYDDELEFDSDEIGLYSFDFEDVKQIKSYNIMSTNIEGVASFDGLLRFKDNNLTIIQGDTNYNFIREQIVSFAKSGDREINYWSGKVTLSLDIRAGNKEQFDYTANASTIRRTDNTRLRLDYLGRVSNVDSNETANDHRINEKFDVYLTRDFFVTPLFSEYYQDAFQNIDSQYTVGVGIGYTVINKKHLEWDISGGPAAIKSNYIAVAPNEDSSSSSASLELSTRIEYEITKMTDISFDSKFTFTGEKSGRYKHHIVLVFENELLSWLDFDITGIWDYTDIPEKDELGISPLQDDYQLLFGLGIEF